MSGFLGQLYATAQNGGQVWPRPRYRFEGSAGNDANVGGDEITQNTEAATPFGQESPPKRPSNVPVEIKKVQPNPVSTLGVQSPTSPILIAPKPQPRPQAPSLEVPTAIPTAPVALMTPFSTEAPSDISPTLDRVEIAKPGAKTANPPTAERLPKFEAKKTPAQPSTQDPLTSEVILGQAPVAPGPARASAPNTPQGVSEPVVQIHIGRIEVRAPAAQSPAPRPQPAVSLSDYLAQRQRR